MSKQFWIEKLNLEVVDQEDGGCLITIEWDETDPDLAEWTSWGEDKQKTFILDSLFNALECFIDDDH
jgi:hypothetical protein